MKERNEKLEVHDKEKQNNKKKTYTKNVIFFNLKSGQIQWFSFVVGHI